MILEIRPEVWTNKRHSIRHKDSLRSVWSRISELVMKVTTLEARMDAFIERFEQRILEHVVPPATSTSPVKAPPVSVKAPPLSNGPTAAPPLAMELPPPPKPPALSLLAVKAPPVSVKAPLVSNGLTAAPPLAVKKPPPPRPPEFAGVPDPPKAPPKAPMVKPPAAKPPPPAIPKGPPPRLPGDEAPASVAGSSTGSTPHRFSPRIVTRSSTGSS